MNCFVGEVCMVREYVRHFFALGVSSTSFEATILTCITATRTVSMRSGKVSRERSVNRRPSIERGANNVWEMNIEEALLEATKRLKKNAIDVPSWILRSNYLNVDVNV